MDHNTGSSAGTEDKLLHLVKETKLPEGRQAGPGASQDPSLAAPWLPLGLCAAAVLPGQVLAHSLRASSLRAPPSKPRLQESPWLSVKKEPPHLKGLTEHCKAKTTPTPPMWEGKRQGGGGRADAPQEAALTGTQPLLKAVTDGVLKGSSFWPVYIFSHFFCNNKGGKSQGENWLYR